MTKLIRISADDDDSLSQGFAYVYKTAFGEAPYFESYEDAWVVDNVWTPHKKHCIFVTTNNGLVSGLGCAHPVNDSLSPVKKFLQDVSSGGQELPFPIDTTLYMSELAVLPQFRNQGLGRELVKARMLWGKTTGYSHFCMRTAAEGSNSRKLYESLGARPADFVQSVADENIDTQSASRIILYGKL